MRDDMKRQAFSPTATDDNVQALLDLYRCPVPFHAVRTRFLGNIATPGAGIAPFEMLKRLWGGELPPFDTIEDVNGLLEVLVMGLWNRLTRHQERSAPFRLIRIDAFPTREGLSLLSRTRREEIEGFVDGLFGDSESLDLPERAHNALAVLGEIRAMSGSTELLVEDAAKGFAPEAAKATLGHFRELTRIAEHEIHEAVLCCVRARRQMMAGATVPKPSIH